MNHPTPIDVAVRLTDTTAADPRIASWRLSDAQKARMRAELPVARFAFCDDEATFLHALPAARAAVVWSFRPEWADLAPHLEWVATPAAGRDYFPPPPPRIECTYGSFHGRIIGETVLGMLLAASRGLLQAQAAQHAGDPWPRVAIAPAMRTLRGGRAVILGYGAIGRWIARYLAPMGVRVAGVRRHPVPENEIPGVEVLPPAAIDALLPSADFLVLALPGTPETEGILDVRRIALLSPSCIVCNVGRGSAVDEDALADALRAGRLRAACLDVFRIEPLPAGSPLLRCPNLFAFPHSSAIAPEYLDLFLDEYVALFRARRWRG